MTLQLKLHNYYRDAEGSVVKIVQASEVHQFYKHFGRTFPIEKFAYYSDWDFFGVYVVMSGKMSDFPSWQTYRSDGNAYFKTREEEENESFYASFSTGDEGLNLIEDLGPEFDNAWLTG